MKLEVEKLENGNYWVHVFKDGKLVIERAYGKNDISGVVSLLLITFPP